MDNWLPPHSHHTDLSIPPSFALERTSLCKALSLSAWADLLAPVGARRARLYFLVWAQRRSPSVMNSMVPATSVRRTRALHRASRPSTEGSG